MTSERDPARAARAFSDVRCSRCHGARLLHVDGSAGACSFLGCPAPCHDLDAERFRGVRGRVLGTHSELGHVLTVAEYTFPDGESAPYVEVSETHDGFTGPSKLYPLSGAVHVLQNVGEDERWDIEARET